MVSAYFHLYAAGQWETPTREFLEAMVDSGLAGEARVLHLGLIGSEEQRDDAWSVRTRSAITSSIATPKAPRWLTSGRTPGAARCTSAL